jgi:hypothetical protein
VNEQHSKGTAPLVACSTASVLHAPHEYLCIALAGCRTPRLNWCDASVRSQDAAQEHRVPKSSALLLVQAMMCSFLSSSFEWEQPTARVAVRPYSNRSKAPFERRRHARVPQSRVERYAPPSWDDFRPWLIRSARERGTKAWAVASRQSCSRVE